MYLVPVDFTAKTFGVAALLAAESRRDLRPPSANLFSAVNISSSAMKQHRTVSIAMLWRGGEGGEKGGEGG